MQTLLKIIISLTFSAVCFANGAVFFGTTAIGCTPVVIPGGGQFTNATYSSFTQGAATLTANAVLSPACITSGATLLENSANNTHEAFANVSFTVLAQSYTYTSYIKQLVGTRNVTVQVSSSSFASSAFVIINPTTCGVVQAASFFGTFTAASSVQTAVANGWCKVQLLFTPASDTSLWLFDIMNSGTTTPYMGDGLSTVGLWGADLR